MKIDLAAAKEVSLEDYACGPPTSRKLRYI